MKIHEFQAKEVISSYGVPTPQGFSAKSLEEVDAALQKLPGEIYVVKAQIHAGGRGLGGGVKVSQGQNEAKKNAADILGMQLITKQTGAEGQKVKTLLIEEGIGIKTELYCSVLVDRARQQIVILASTEGGMEIEEVAAKTPEKIIKEHVDPAIGFRNFQAQRLCYGLKLEQYGKTVFKKSISFFKNLYDAFLAEDCSLLEINPTVITEDERILALDCKMTYEDNALYRQPKAKSYRDPDEEDPAEMEAKNFGLNFIKLDGTIGCMVNGAGLAMATMDMIKAFGEMPANFLDVGGTADAKRVEEAFKLILKDHHVNSIFVNIFGGIVQCDMIAEGIIAAYKQIQVGVPIVIRLQGTNADKAQEIINASGLKEHLIMIPDLKLAAQKAIEVAKG